MVVTFHRGYVKTFNVSTGKEVRDVKAHTMSDVKCLAWASHKGAPALVTGSADGTLVYWTFDDGATVWKLELDTEILDVVRVGDDWLVAGEGRTAGGKPKNTLSLVSGAGELLKTFKRSSEVFPTSSRSFGSTATSGCSTACHFLQTADGSPSPGTPPSRLSTSRTERRPRPYSSKVV